MLTAADRSTVASMIDAAFVVNQDEFVEGVVAGVSDLHRLTSDAIGVVYGTVQQTRDDGTADVLLDGDPGGGPLNMSVIGSTSSAARGFVLKVPPAGSYFLGMQGSNVGGDLWTYDPITGLLAPNTLQMNPLNEIRFDTQPTVVAPAVPVVHEAGHITGSGEWWFNMDGVTGGGVTGSFISYWYDGVHGYPNTMQGPTGNITWFGINEFDSGITTFPTIPFQSTNVYRNKVGAGDVATVGAFQMGFSPQIVADGNILSAAPPTFDSGLIIPLDSPVQQEMATPLFDGWSLIIDDSYYTAINGGHLDFTANDGKSIGFFTLPVFAGHVDFSSRFDFWAKEVAFWPQQTNNYAPDYRTLAGTMTQGSPDIAAVGLTTNDDVGITVIGDGVPPDTVIGSRTGLGFTMNNKFSGAYAPAMSSGNKIFILQRMPTMQRHVALRTDHLRAANINRVIQGSNPIELFPDPFTHWRPPGGDLNAMIGSTGTLYLDFHRNSFGTWLSWEGTVQYKQDADALVMAAGYAHQATYKNARRTLSNCTVTNGNNRLSSTNGAPGYLLASGRHGAADFGPGDLGAAIHIENLFDVLDTTITQVLDKDTVILAANWPGTTTTGASATVTNLGGALDPLIWSGATTYSAGTQVQLVVGGTIYISLLNGNLNHTPPNATWWRDVAWSNAFTYAFGDIVTYQSVNYSSLQNGNLNHLPTDPAWWQRLPFQFSPAYDAFLAPTFVADGAHVSAEFLVGLTSDPTFSTSNGGSMSLVGINGAEFGATVGAGVSMLGRSGVEILNANINPAATVGAQIGLLVDPLSGATANIGFQNNWWTALTQSYSVDAVSNPIGGVSGGGTFTINGSTVVRTASGTDGTSGGDLLGTPLFIRLDDTMNYTLDRSTAADGHTTAGSSAFSSASANFGTDDEGAFISGPGITGFVTVHPLTATTATLISGGVPYLATSTNTNGVYTFNNLIGPSWGSGWQNPWTTPGLAYGLSPAGPRALIQLEGTQQWNFSSKFAGAHPLIYFQNTYKNVAGVAANIGSNALTNIGSAALADGASISIATAPEITAPNIFGGPADVSGRVSSDFTATYAGYWGWLDNKTYGTINGGTLNASAAEDISFGSIPMLFGKVHLGKRIAFQVREPWMSAADGGSPTLDTQIGVYMEPMVAAGTNLSMVLNNAIECFDKDRTYKASPWKDAGNALVGGAFFNFSHKITLDYPTPILGSVFSFGPTVELAQPANPAGIVSAYAHTATYQNKNAVVAHLAGATTVYSSVTYKAQGATINGGDAHSLYVAPSYVIGPGGAFTPFTTNAAVECDFNVGAGAFVQTRYGFKFNNATAGVSRLDTQYGIYIGYLALAAANNYGIYNASTTVYPGQTVNLANNSSNIPITSTTTYLTSAANRLLGSTPTLVGGIEGEYAVLVNTSNVQIALIDRLTLPGSGLALGTSTVTLNQYQAISLIYNQASGLWVQIGGVGVAGGGGGTGTITPSAIVSPALAGGGQFIIQDFGGNNVGINLYKVQGDAQPLVALGTGNGLASGLFLGPGGAGALDVSLVRSGAAAAQFTGALTFNNSVTHANGANIIAGTGAGLKIATATTQKIGFYGATAVVQQTQGATLTNNVTAGGTANTLANFTNLTTYSVDAGTIRNNIYQLGQTLKTVVDALRTYGLLS